MPPHPVTSLGRENSLTFLRLAFALAVACGHSWVRGGFGEEPLHRLTDGALSGRAFAVQGFFILSGFHRQIARRKPVALAFRILPAFWVYLGLMVFVLAPWLIAVRWPDRFGYVERLTLGPLPAWNYLLKKLGASRRRIQPRTAFCRQPCALRC